jgi:hypothetical protein
VNSNWPVKELDRQIGTSLFARLLLSDGKANKAKAKVLAPETAGSSAMVGYGDIMTGSTFFALGLARGVAGAYNGTLLDDLETILVYLP